MKQRWVFEKKFLRAARAVLISDHQQINKLFVQVVTFVESWGWDKNTKTEVNNKKSVGREKMGWNILLLIERRENNGKRGIWNQGRKVNIQTLDTII